MLRSTCSALAPGNTVVIVIELGGTAGKGVQGYSYTWEDGSSQVFAFCGNTVKGDGRSKIDDDQIAIEFEVTGIVNYLRYTFKRQ